MQTYLSLHHVSITGGSIKLQVALQVNRSTRYQALTATLHYAPSHQSHQLSYTIARLSISVSLQSLVLPSLAEAPDRSHVFPPPLNLLKCFADRSPLCAGCNYKVFGRTGAKSQASRATMLSGKAPGLSCISACHVVLFPVALVHDQQDRVTYQGCSISGSSTRFRALRERNSSISYKSVRRCCLVEKHIIEGLNWEPYAQAADVKG